MKEEDDEEEVRWKKKCGGHPPTLQIAQENKQTSKQASRQTNRNQIEFKALVFVLNFYFQKIRSVVYKIHVYLSNKYFHFVLYPSLFHFIFFLLLLLLSVSLSLSLKLFHFVNMENEAIFFHTIITFISLFSFILFFSLFSFISFLFCSFLLFSMSVTNILKTTTTKSKMYEIHGEGKEDDEKKKNNNR